MTNISLLTVLGLAFCLTEHDKYCASPCSIPISTLYVCKDSEEKRRNLHLYLFSAKRSSIFFRPWWQQ